MSQSIVAAILIVQKDRGSGVMGSNIPGNINSGSPDPLSVVKTIDSAIETRAAVLSFDGLTVSTLAFGGASLFWFLVSGTNISNLFNLSTLRLYMLVFLSVMILMSTWRLLNSSARRHRDTSPRLIAIWVQRIRIGPLLLVKSIHGFALSWLVLVYFDIPLMPRLALSLVFLSGVIGLILFYWPNRSIDWLVEGKSHGRLTSPSKAIIFLLLILVFGVSALAIYAGVLGALRYWAAFNIIHVRTVLLLATSIAILHQISRRFGEQSLLQELVAIRDSVAFERLSANDGWDRARLLIVGGNNADLIRPELDAIYKYMKMLKEAFKLFASFASALAKAIEETDSAEVEVSVLKEKMGKDYTDLMSLLKEFRDSAKNIKKFQEKAMRKARFAHYVYGDGGDLLVALKEAFVNQGIKLDGDLRELIKSSCELRQALERKGVKLNQVILEE